MDASHDHNTPSDETLMQRYRDGDADAFEVLYRRHKGGLYRYFLRQCNNNTSTAEELFQDAWLKLIKSRERYEVKARFTTYLYHIAHNRLIDHYRKQRPEIIIEYETTETESNDDIAMQVTHTPEQQLDIQHRVDRLLSALENLPGPQREAFLLREEAGMSVEDIASATGIKPEAAKSRLRYATKKLRQALIDEPLTDDAPVDKPLKDESVRNEV